MITTNVNDSRYDIYKTSTCCSKRPVEEVMRPNVSTEDYKDILIKNEVKDTIKLISGETINLYDTIYVINGKLVKITSINTKLIGGVLDE